MTTEVDTVVVTDVRSDRWVAVVVWGVLVAMTGIFLLHIVRFGRNMPLSEDWNMVPPLAGDEPSFWSWVWSQNNEHRLPVARVLYLAVLQVTRDFRSGMVLNTLIVAGLTAGLVVVAGRLRGRTSIVDAFFPIAMLHLGHWSNLVWGWQLQFVFVTAVIVGLLLLLVERRSPPSLRTVVVLCALVVLLPLGGGTALPMVPAAIAALLAVAWVGHASTPSSRKVVLGASVLTVALVALYFVDWHAATWYPDNPGLLQTLSTTAKAMALGWGPAATYSQHLAVALTIVVMGAAVAALVLGLRRGGADRRRALGLLSFLGGIGLTALAIGYGRAALVPTEGLPDRYVIVTLPALLAAWFAWELFGSVKARFLGQLGLLAVVLLLLPLNVAKGYEWRDWYTAGMDAVERDLAAGAPVAVMVERHGDFLMHWNDDALAARMAMLQAEGIGPFADLEVAAPPG